MIQLANAILIASLFLGSLNVGRTEGSFRLGKEVELAQLADEDLSMIPDPTRGYPCRKDEKSECGQDEDLSIATSIADVIYMEGGGLDLRVAADLLQLLDNRMYLAWNCKGTCVDPNWRMINPDGISYRKITPEQKGRLAQYVMSEPYDTIYGHYATWNSWQIPFPRETVRSNPYLNDVYDSIYASVVRWLETPNIHIQFRDWKVYPAYVMTKDRSIIFAYATYGYSIPYLLSNASTYLHLKGSNGYIYFSSFAFDEN